MNIISDAQQLPTLYKFILADGSAPTGSATDLYITSTLSQMPATTPRSWVIMMMAVLNSRLSSFIRVMI